MTYIAIITACLFGQCWETKSQVTFTSISDCRSYIAAQRHLVREHALGIEIKDADCKRVGGAV